MERSIVQTGKCIDQASLLGIRAGCRRRELGISLSEIRKATGVTNGVIRHFLNGHCERVGLDAAIKICKALGVKLSFSWEVESK